MSSRTTEAHGELALATSSTLAVPRRQPVAPIPGLAKPYTYRRRASRLPEQAVPDAQTVTRKIAQRVRALISVESVYVKANPWGFQCWLVANHSTEEERFRLYDLEWELMDLSPDVGFKFHLVDRQDRPLAEVVTLEHFDAAAVLRKTQNA